MDGLNIYKISKNNYEARRSSKLFSFMWNPEKYKIYNFKKLGGVSEEYDQKGTLLKKPHIQMILQVQNRIGEKISENMKHIKLFENFREGKDLTYEEAKESADYSRKIESYVREKYPEHDYKGGPAGILGRFGHGLTKTNIKKITSLAKRNKDAKLLSLVKDYVDYETSLGLK